jgi:hypothetical protein
VLSPNFALGLTEANGEIVFMLFRLCSGINILVSF